MRAPIHYILLSLLLVCGVAFRISPAFACPDHSGILDVNCDGKVVIVAFGDSITRGVSDNLGIGYPGRLQEMLPDTTVVNLGNPGEQTPSGRGRASRNFSTYADADFYLILEGVNDYWITGYTSKKTRDNVLSMVRSGASHGGIVLLGNLTQVKRSFQKSWVSSVNSQLNSYKQIDYYSLGSGIISSDLLHPNGSGYQTMANLALSILQQATEANRPVDTDGDGVYDFGEVKYGSNPYVADTDGDGLSDLEEIFTYHSSPVASDSDGDGFGDYYEAQNGADPASATPAAPHINSLTIIDRP